MKEFQCDDDQILVSGPVIETFLVALGAYRTRGERVVARACGVPQMVTDEGTFYPLKGYFRALKEFQQQFGPEFLTKIGSFIFEKAVFPPGIDSIDKAMAIIDTAYNMNHDRAAGKIGSYHWSPTGERSGTMVCDNPYPCSFDIGLLTATARRFHPNATVTHVQTDICRHQGGDRCTYRVEW